MATGQGKAAGGPLVDLIHAELKKKGSDFHVAVGCLRPRAHPCEELMVSGSNVKQHQ